MKRKGGPGTPAAEIDEDKEPATGSSETCDAFCTSCRRFARVKLPKRSNKRDRVPAPKAKKTQTSGPIQEEDVVDLDVPENIRKKPKPKPKPQADDPCDKVLTERQLLNVHVRIVELVCRNKSQKETWARPIAKRFSPKVMSTVSFKELLGYSLGKGRPIPPDLALRLFETFRGKRKLKVKPTAA